jgi:phytoene dehydrogenase-like protein
VLYIARKRSHNLVTSLFFRIGFGYNSISFPINRTLYIDPKNSTDSLSIKVYGFDPTLSPEGKTSVTTMLVADNEYWTALKKENPDKYKAEKDRIASEVIDALEERYGNVKVNVEVADVATPDTYIRYTNNYKASFEGFVPTVENFNKSLKSTLPGLENFYMIGQWVQPGGGLPTGGMHGRYLVQRLCKKDGKKFVAIK